MPANKHDTPYSTLIEVLLVGVGGKLKYLQNLGKLFLEY